MMDFWISDPSWKTHPDIVADESADERYIWDDEDCEEENDG